MIKHLLPPSRWRRDPALTYFIVACVFSALVLLGAWATMATMLNWQWKETLGAEMRQNANIDQMIWSIPEIIAALSRSWVLAPGDLIFTGTPAGVGPLVGGDAIACGVEGLPELNFSVTHRE